MSAVVSYYRRSEFTTDSKFTTHSVFSTGGSFGYLRAWSACVNLIGAISEPFAREFRL